MPAAGRASSSCCGCVTLDSNTPSCQAMAKCRVKRHVSMSSRFGRRMNFFLQSKRGGQHRPTVSHTRRAASPRSRTHQQLLSPAWPFMTRIVILRKMSQTPERGSVHLSHSRSCRQAQETVSAYSCPGHRGSTERGQCQTVVPCAADSHRLPSSFRCWSARRPSPSPPTARGRGRTC